MAYQAVLAKLLPMLLGSMGGGGGDGAGKIPFSGMIPKPKMQIAQVHGTPEQTDMSEPQQAGGGQMGGQMDPSILAKLLPLLKGGGMGGA